MKILLVDDDSISLELLHASLAEEGHELVTATDGLAALEALTRDSIRMVITDWMMPRMDGLDLCRQIRARSAPHYVYVIMLTARRETGDVIRGLSAGADEFVAKPVDPAELKVRIRTGERILSVESRHVAIFGMAKLAESRDPETGMHLERIREYARVLCGHLANMSGHGEQITKEFTETLFLTAPLHDIGKVGIPDAILLKPGRLDDEEFQVMKTHTLIGGETLGAAAQQYPGVQYLCMARDIALMHHERYDGKGYPYGQAGKNIPLCARIVCLADVYDALTSKRVYKTAFTHNIARSMIRDERGGHFDPDVVDAFLAGQEDFRQIRERFAEDQLSMARYTEDASPSAAAPAPFTRG